MMGFYEYGEGKKKSD